MTNKSKVSAHGFKNLTYNELVGQFEEIKRQLEYSRATNAELKERNNDLMRQLQQRQHSKADATDDATAAMTSNTEKNIKSVQNANKRSCFVIFIKTQQKSLALVLSARNAKRNTMRNAVKKIPKRKRNVWRNIVEKIPKR